MQYIMKGGNPLVGEVYISGAKNAALPLLAAAIMTDEDVILENIPNVSDINVMLDVIRGIGASVERLDPHTVKINGEDIRRMPVDTEPVRKMRAGYYLLGALLGKYRHAEVAQPGGCKIGARPIDLHLKGFRALNAIDREIIIENEEDPDKSYTRVMLDAKELVGSTIYMDKVSVGATINIMLAAALAEGMTVIENAAMEPHIVDVANMLNCMGASIRGAGTKKIRIRGVNHLHGVTYAVIPDQIEAGTFMMAAAATRGDVTITNVIPVHMDAISSKLREMGCEIVEEDDRIRVVGKPVLRTCNVVTEEYPGFPTDMQPQIGTVLCVADGMGRITENIFENRLGYTRELVKMGACIELPDHEHALFTGVRSLHGADVSAPDLRAGAALVIAGLAAEGITTVSDIQYILRGYEEFSEKLRSLGAIIELVKTKEEADEFRRKNS